MSWYKRAQQEEDILGDSVAEALGVSPDTAPRTTPEGLDNPDAIRAKIEHDATRDWLDYRKNNPSLFYGATATRLADMAEDFAANAISEAVLDLEDFDVDEMAADLTNKLLQAAGLADMDQP